jgi:Fic family protein
MTLDATRNFEELLSHERLYGWHAALFPTGRNGTHKITVGSWRLDEAGPMQVVSGPIGSERIHFQAPSAERLNDEMEKFIKCFNQDTEIDLVIKAAIAHLWFLTIHPFDDGNGRIARAIADMLLSKADGVKERFYSMSSGIESERKEYYVQLESAQRGSLDITSWLAWFLGCLDRAIDASDIMLSSVIYKAQLWQKINTKPVNDRQRKAINKMLEHDWQGYLNTSKYARLNKTSPDTALRDINELLERGILIKNKGGGRSTSYQLADLE